MAPADTVVKLTPELKALFKEIDEKLIEGKVKAEIRQLESKLEGKLEAMQQAVETATSAAHSAHDKADEALQLHYALDQALRDLNVTTNGCFFPSSMLVRVPFGLELGEFHDKFVKILKSLGLLVSIWDTKLLKRSSRDEREGMQQFKLHCAAETRKEILYKGREIANATKEGAYMGWQLLDDLTEMGWAERKRLEVTKTQLHQQGLRPCWREGAVLCVRPGGGRPVPYEEFEQQQKQQQAVSGGGGGASGAEAMAITPKRSPLGARVSAAQWASQNMHPMAGSSPYIRSRRDPRGQLGTVGMAHGASGAGGAAGAVPQGQQNSA